MKSSRSWLRSRLFPVALVALAAALTVPWTFWVIRTAYDRHLLENAKSLARRVELRVAQVPAGPVRSNKARDALKTEFDSDPTVQLVGFCDTFHYFPNFELVGWVREGTDASAPQWSRQEIHARAVGGVRREESAGRVAITVPWVHQESGKALSLGFTYLEFSRDALRQDFWDKEGPLLRRVIGLTAAAIAFLSALGVLATQALNRAGRVEQRAELARQGLLAERGLTAAVLAHEIRNPLAALRFQLHSLRRNAADVGRVATTADTIDGELSRIQQLVTDYLEHERARTVRVQSVDLVDAVRKLQELMEELLREGSTTLSVATPPDPVVVVCEPHALRQVLMNLVLNAEQAMRGMREQGQAAANADAPPATIRVTIGQSEGFGTIDVSDTGPGIPPEMRDRLFKPFQTSKREGTGLGLALVKRFVDNFAGSVGVESEPGRGTTFRLKLPLAGDAAVTPDPLYVEAPTPAAVAPGAR